MDQADEKRNYYRVSETLGLHLVPLPADADTDRLPNEWFPDLNAPNWLDEFRALQRDLQREIVSLGTETANTIKLLLRQNELLAGALMKSQVQPELTLSNLSEGGLSFETDATLIPGQTLAMAILLNTTALPMFCYGQVVRVTPGTDARGQSSLVAVGFVDISASTRDMIARQVLQSQRKRGA